MYAQPASRRTGVDVPEIGLRLAAVALALGASYIHSTLGGLLFTLNAIGFATLAAGLVFPFGWLVGARYARPLRLLARLALMGFAAATVGGWVMFGARYSTGYMATASECVLVVLLGLDVARAVGGPVSVVRELLRLVPAPLRRAAA